MITKVIKYIKNKTPLKSDAKRILKIKFLICEKKPA